MDDNGNPVPFASVYIKEKSRGTISDENGKFEINIDPGYYQIYFQAINFENKQQSILIDKEWIEVNIILTSKIYHIDEVTIKNGSNDRAIQIMKKAIAMAPYYQNYIDNYQSIVYLKGNLTIDRLIKFFSKKSVISVNGKTFHPEEGDIYLLETFSQLNYKRPNNYEQKVISSKNSIPLPINNIPIGYFVSDIYQDEINNAYSPLSKNAFRYYKFKHEGFFYEDSMIINKIKVTPKRKNNKVCEGYVFVVDGLWCIHSLDLMNKSFGAEIKYSQIFKNIDQNVWLPINQHLEIIAKYPGIKANSIYNSSIDYKNIEMNKGLAIPAIIQNSNEYDGKEAGDDGRTEFEHDKLNMLLEKKDLTKRDVVKIVKQMKNEIHEKDSIDIEKKINYTLINDSTTQQDTVSWEKIRTIPLSENELTSYAEKDSMIKYNQFREVQDQKKYKKIIRTIQGRKPLVKNDTNQLWYSGALKIKNTGFNTVDGFTYSQQFTYSHQFDSIKSFNVSPSLEYAFSRNELNWNLPLRYESNRNIKYSAILYVGSVTSDFNEINGTPATLNALSSLFFKENVNRFYQKNYIKLVNTFEKTDKYNVNLYATYYQPQIMHNNTNFSLLIQKKEYYSNNDLRFENSSIENNMINTFKIGSELTYHLKHSSQAFNKTSIKFKYEKSIPGFAGSKASFNLIGATINQPVNFKEKVQLDIAINGGIFINSKTINFADYKHFNNNTLPVTLKNPTNFFALLNNYEGTTNTKYYCSHLQGSFNNLLIKHLPVIRNTGMNENIYINHFYTPEFLHYTELGYGIGNIFSLVELGAYAGFKGETYDRWGIRLELPFRMK